MVDIDQIKQDHLHTGLGDNDHLTEFKAGTLRALLDELTALRAAQQWRGIGSADNDLEVAARDLLASMSSTYRARNGRQVGIEADDGEKCYIVHSDHITGLEAALALSPTPQPLPPGDGQ